MRTKNQEQKSQAASVAAGRGGNLLLNLGEWCPQGGNGKRSIQSVVCLWMQQAWICKLEQKTLDGFPPEQEAWAGTVKGSGAWSGPAHSYSARDTGCEQPHRDVDESI